MAADGGAPGVAAESRTDSPGSEASSSGPSGSAEDRSVLASERTYTAWMRTGFAALVSGLAVLRFMEQILPDWGLRLLALGLTAYSGFCFGAAAWRHRHVGRCFPQAEIPHLPGWLVLLASAAMLAGSVLAAFLVCFP